MLDFSGCSMILISKDVYEEVDRELVHSAGFAFLEPMGCFSDGDFSDGTR